MNVASRAAPCKHGANEPGGTRVTSRTRRHGRAALNATRRHKTSLDDRDRTAVTDPSNEQGCALRPFVKRFLSLEAPHCKHDANVVPAPRDRATARRPSRDRADDHLSVRLGTRTTRLRMALPLRTEYRATGAGVMSPYRSNENEPRIPPVTRVLNSSSTTPARVPSERAIASRSTSAACAAAGSPSNPPGAPTERRKRRAAGASVSGGTW